MTPANMAGMASLAELQLVALTDHNSCKNCPAFLNACAEHGIAAIAGCELTTAEDIHLVCLFPQPADAMTFDADLQAHRMPMPNRPERFGKQEWYDKNDVPVGEDPWFLPAATDLDLERAVAFVHAHAGFCYPAHIDRESNGLLSILGAFPPSPVFTYAELRDVDNINLAGGRARFVCSDAHRLWEIGDTGGVMELDLADDFAESIVQALFERLLEKT